MSTIDEQYDQLIDLVFKSLSTYQRLMDELQQLQYDGFDYMNEAERQAGIFSVQLNSSSYFSVPLSAQYGVDITNPLQTLITNRTIEQSLVKNKGKKDVELSDDDDDTSDDDNNIKSRVYSPQQLLKLFALSPSQELSQAQQTWVDVIKTKIPLLLNAKQQLINAIDDVERFKIENGFK